MIVRAVLGCVRLMRSSKCTRGTSRSGDLLRSLSNPLRSLSNPLRSLSNPLRSLSLSKGTRRSIHNRRRPTGP
ncbi:hypothetical protein PLANTIT3_80208 [Plantibacter sp. T3]|nr:hypothetical protein PLANTIT3_80208 [Plantibacter sp. T3]